MKVLDNIYASLFILYMAWNSSSEGAQAAAHYWFGEDHIAADEDLGVPVFRGWMKPT